MISLTNATLIDGTGDEPAARDVVVDGDRIVAVLGRGDERAPPSEAERLDLTGLTLLPGLIDLHTHMGLVFPADGTPQSPALTAALLFDNARRCLMSGHTTAREVSGADGGLARLIDDGVVPGPRLFPSGPLLCQSGGHGDERSPWAHDPMSHGHGQHGIPGLSQPSVVCDGPDEARRAARLAFKHGATQIKVCVSGGVVSFTDSIEDTQFTLDELRAVVEEARARQTYVTGHALNVASIRNGLAAGLECFEHGAFLDEETAELMAAAGAALVPTLSIAHLMVTHWQQFGVPEVLVSRINGVEEAMAASVKLAADAGVLIGSGTDLLGPGQDRRGLELVLKAKVLGAMRAIVSATSDSARILRRDDLGVVAAGKTADIIAVSGDPLTEPELFDDPDRVVLVVKNGCIVKDSRRP